MYAPNWILRCYYGCYSRNIDVNYYYRLIMRPFDEIRENPVIVGLLTMIWLKEENPSILFMHKYVSQHRQIFFDCKVTAQNYPNKWVILDGVCYPLEGTRFTELSLLLGHEFSIFNYNLILSRCLGSAYDGNTVQVLGNTNFFGQRIVRYGFEPTLHGLFIRSQLYENVSSYF